MMTGADELAKILKMGARVANRGGAQRAAELEADVEQQLATRFKIAEATRAELTFPATQAVEQADEEQADAELAKRYRALGIPEEFRPGLTISWYGRGENADAKRRTELRRLAYAKIDALAQQAGLAIETAVLDGLTHLTVGAPEAEAQAFLAAMPTVEALMPAALDVSTLGTLALPGAGTRRIHE